jgi:adenylate kinase
MRIVLFGEPGVGKGTLGSMLSEKYDAQKLSTGDLFRAEIANNTALGQHVKGILAAGQLVSDDIVLRIVKEMFNNNYQSGFILDGFPRTVPQGMAFDDMMKEHGWKLDAIVRIKVDVDEIIRRLSARRQCEKCGTAFNLVSSPPKVAWQCDKCGGKLVQRPDDEPQVVRKRLEVYESQTRSVVDYYKRKGLLREVDVSGLPVDHAFRRLVQTIENK